MNIQLIIFIQRSTLPLKMLASLISTAIVFTVLSLSPALATEPVFNGDGQPSRSNGGGSRGDECPETELSVLPLLPAESQGGWSTESNPTVWVYIPFGLTPDYELNFTIRDSQGQTVHQVWLDSLSTEPGVLRFAVPAMITLPETSVDMAEPEVWIWSVSVFCDPAGGRPEVARGGIRRVDAAVTVPETRSPLAISEAYVESGIWYDALTTLGNARLENPDDPELEAAWQTLLSYSTVGLEAIAIEPLVDCCALPE